jgi:hypothetical protein
MNDLESNKIGMQIIEDIMKNGFVFHINSSEVV